MRVLLLEDNLADARLVEAQLRPLNASVTRVARVCDALEALRRTVYDVILCDLDVPDGAGLETLTRLLPHVHGRPILVLTGGDEGAGVQALRAGATDFLAKGPQLFDALPRVVAYAHERAQLQRRMAKLDRLSTMGQIAAGVAHELANPAAFVGLNQQLIAERLKAIQDGSLPVEPALAECLSMMEDNRQGIARMAELLRDLGRFARPDEVTRLEEVDLTQIVEDATRFLSKSLSDRVALRLELEPVPVIRGDVSRLHQVLTNLLVNARDATPPGRPDAEIVIRCWRADQTVIVTVADQGRGMADGVVAHVFEPFFTTKGALGTGLGLALSAEIIRQHGGTIAVDSAVDAGSTFTLTFPIVRRLEAPAAPRRARVLVMDDELTVLRAVGRALRTRHEVETVSTVREAVEQLRARDWDLILADVMMPDGGGPALYRWLEAKRPLLKDRLVFCTGGLVDEELRGFCRAVPNRVLYKPVAIELLRHLAADAADRLSWSSQASSAPAGG